MTDRKPAPLSISFADPEVQQCPFPAYDRLRTEQPVYIDPKTGNYVLTRYEDVRKVALNPKLFSNRTGLIQTRNTTPITQKMFAEKGWLPLDTLVSNDPPSHKLYRTLVDKAFTANKILALEPRIEEICDALIDQFIDQDEIDFVQAFGIALPMTMIAEQLGVGPEHMADYKVWSDLSVESTSPALTPEREIATTEGIIRMQNYFAERADYFRAHPDDDKLFSRLLHAEVDGRRLANREVMSILQQLLVAGNETTTAALSAGMKLLIENPDLVPQLRERPDLIKTFVEETLRLMAPIQALFRKVLADTEIGGITVPAGAMVEIRWGSANLDPAVYENPGCLNLSRGNASSHMSFGAGIHLCIGNQLARGELRVAFARLIDRMDNFRASRGADSYGYAPMFISYAVTQLWMTFDRR
ncbi:cytochrome P450 [Sphingobium sp. JS3065]|uniref:cytochrome P450 n=1 Tax=Sphingobium sp. JS3065 TaxID=2970925 RepID=UPI002264F46F|nr:cytochrome P450 [Sphingobium sp. JS3065]UZW57051.1 cytochrome P450 [Sphingobium sp. JS3065]